MLVQHPDCRVNVTDWLWSTALHIAAHEGYAEAVNVLASHPRCDFSITDCVEHTAADIARSQGHVDVAALIDAKSKGNG